MKFRIPELYINWPSADKGWRPGSIDNPYYPAGVCPMSIHDELTVRIPDSLLSGQATVQVIQSCIPSVKNAWMMPIADFIPALRSIYIASNQGGISVRLKCPKCEQFNEFTIDLTSVNLDTSGWYAKKQIDDFEFSFRSPIFQDLNSYNLSLFQNYKKMYQLMQMVDSEDKNLEASEIASNMFTNTINLLCAAIESISVPSAGILVTDRSQIYEFLQNIEKSITEELISILNSRLEQSNLPDMLCHCPEIGCTHEFKSKLNLDFCENFRLRIIPMNQDEILKYFNVLGGEGKQLRDEAIKIVWFMRGGISLEEAMDLSQRDREIINKNIKENLKVTKETGLNFF